jgi:hypothetical protein
VQALSDAFRSGYITADDIVERAGQVGQLKKKAEIQMLSEQTSPEGIAARAAAMKAATAQAGLQSAQATAAGPLVEPTAALQQQQLERQVAYQKYPAAQLFDQYAPVLGLQEPTTPDKQIDWSKKASIGVQIGEHIRLQNEAKEKLANITTEKSPDGSVIAAFTKQGIPVNSAEVQKLETQARSPFTFTAVAPGSVAAAPTPAASTVTGGTTPATPAVTVTPQARAAAVEQFGVAPEQAAVMTGAQIGGLVQPKVVPGAKPAIVPAMGQPVGAGFSLGPPKSKDTAEKILPAEGVRDLNLSRQVIGGVNRIQQRYQELINSEPHLVGFLEGRLANWTASREWNDKVAAFQTEVSATLAPLAKGVFGETGVLSDKDVIRYEAVLPSLRDTPKIGTAKLEQLFKTTNDAFQTKVNGWDRAGYDVTGFSDLVVAPGATAAPTSTPAVGGVLQLPSTGRKIVRDANGTYRLAQ